MTGGGGLWSVSVPGVLPGHAVLVELDTGTGVVRVQASGSFGIRHAIISHEQLIQLVRVMMGWPVEHGHVMSIAESAQ